MARGVTVKELEALGEADHGRKIAFGDSMVGTVRHGKEGTAVYVSWRYRVAGKTREIHVGTWQVAGVSLKALRDERDRLALQLRDGVDPIEARRDTLASVKAQARAEAAKVQEEAAEAEAEAQERVRQIEKEQREKDEAARTAALEAARRQTVRQLFENWRAIELSPKQGADGSRTGRKDGGQYVADQFERHVFPTLGDTAVEDVRKADIMGILDTQTGKGQMRTAGVLLSDLRQMFEFAVDRELVEVNPVARLKKARVVGKAVERERALTENEVGELAAAVPMARMSARSEAAVWLTLGTGVRVGECMGAVWADTLPQAPRTRQAKLAALRQVADEHGVKLGVVDLEAAKWHVFDTKNGRDHVVHLSAFTLAQFAKLRALRVKLPEADELTPWVFPSRDTSVPVCVKSFSKQIADRQRPPERRMSGRSLKTDALTLTGGQWTPHDLRRTAGTLMARLGVSGDVIDECLNHMLESKVRRIYIRDRREEEQVRAFDALGARLEALVNGVSTAANVVTLRAA